MRPSQEEKEKMMMEMTLGSKIAKYRKEKNWKQDQLAEMLGVTPQAVSKWENDLSCPDVMMLPKLAQIFGVTIDELLSNKVEPETRLVPVKERKKPDDMILHVNVLSAEGDKVKVNLPIPLVKVALEMGMSMNVQGGDVLKNIDINKILEMVDRGLVGKLVEVESAEGDMVEIVVE